MKTKREPIAGFLPGRDVILPNGETAMVAMTSGLSALVRVGHASAWYPIADLRPVPE
jgi:hypothetical protein